jgi:hypothetical protein
VDHAEDGFCWREELIHSDISAFSHFVVTPIVEQRTAIDNRVTEK